MDSYLRIGELARQSGLSVEAIRYYERRGLISPSGRLPSGYRTYHPDSLQRLSFIRRCKDLGFSLDDILELLNLQQHPEYSSAEVKKKVEEKIALVEEKIHQLQQLNASLHQLNSLCCGDGAVADCPIMGFLKETPSEDKDQ